MKKSRRILATVLTIFLCLSLFPAAAFAEDANSVGLDLAEEVTETEQTAQPSAEAAYAVQSADEPETSADIASEEIAAIDSENLDIPYAILSEDELCILPDSSEETVSNEAALDTTYNMILPYATMAGSYATLGDTFNMYFATYTFVSSSSYGYFIGVYDSDSNYLDGTHVTCDNFSTGSGEGYFPLDTSSMSEGSYLVICATTVYNSSTGWDFIDDTINSFSLTIQSSSNPMTGFYLYSDDARYFNGDTIKIPTGTATSLSPIGQPIRHTSDRSFYATLSDTTYCSSNEGFDGYVRLTPSSSAAGKSATLTVTYGAITNKYTVQFYDPDAVSITTQPKACSVAVDSTASFSVTASGTDLTYQWYYSKDNGSSWTSLGTSYQTASISFKVSSASIDGRLYRCVVKNSSGNTVTSNSAKLTIIPAITAQPKACSVAAGSTASFSVTATGSNLTYQWYYSKDSGSTWTSLGSSYQTASISFKASSTSISGRLYRCVVTGNGKSVTSSSAKLTVTALSITAQPKACSVALNSTASFSVTASGTGLTYQWYYSKDSGSSWTSLGSSYQTASISFKAGSTSISGRLYRCVVKDSSGNTVTSNSAKLTVTALSITTQPKACSAALNSTASFSVKATGVGLTYQWYYSKDSGSSWTSLGSSYQTASISFKAGSTSISGRLYRCVVKDSGGNTVTSSSAKLTVVELSITAQPKACSVAVDSTASFSVTATGVGLTYQWYYSKDNGSSWTSLGSSYQTAAISFKAGSASIDGRLYRCIVKDSGGSKVTSKSVKLTIIPKITAQPKACSVALNSTASFSVTATGSNLTYQWYYSKDNGSTWTSLGSSYQTAAISFKAGSTSISGRLYRCVVTGNGKSVTSSSAKLTVK